MPLDKLKQCDNGNIEQCDNGNIVRCCAFGETLWSAKPGIDVLTGTGGNSTIIWVCSYDPNKVYELDNSDGSILRSSNAPGSYPAGIGGMDDVIWHCDTTYDKVYELSPTDFSVLQKKTSPADLGPAGIGGDNNVVWCWEGYGTNEGDWKIYKLSPTDLSTLDSGNAPDAPYRAIGGIGGTENIIWHVMQGSLYELSISDYSVLRSGTPDAGGSGDLRGAGGVTETLWVNNYQGKEIYELCTA